MKHFWKWLGALLLIVIALTTLASFGYRYIGEKITDRMFEDFLSSQEEKRRRYRHLFWQDHHELTKLNKIHKIFDTRESTDNADAGSYLNKRLDWRFLSNKIFHAKDRLELDEAQYTNLFVDQSWLREDNFPMIKDLDFNWMKVLLKYDHWDLGSFSLHKEHLHHTLKKPVNLLYLPVSPRLSQITRPWIMLRYLKALEDKDFKEASLEVRHVIRLLFTNESLVSAMIATSLLRQELLVFAQLPHDLQRTFAVRPLNLKDIERIRRFFMALPSVLPYGGANDLSELKRLEIGYCVALSEYPTYINTLYEPIFKHLIGNELKIMFEAIRENRCRLKVQKLVIAKKDEFHTAMEGIHIFAAALPEDEALQTKDDLSSLVDLQTISEYPFISRMISRTILTVLTIDHFHLYENLLEKNQPDAKKSDQ